MIKHLRIDNRLIHGQVAVTWMRRINADAIAVVNDDVAKDRIQKMALPLAARDAKVLVLSHQELQDYVKEHPEESLFVIAKYPMDALRILESGLEVGEVNVGNAAPIAGTSMLWLRRNQSPLPKKMRKSIARSRHFEAAN